MSGELPQALIRLPALTKIYFDRNSGLCAPPSNAFQEWLIEVESMGEVCRPTHAGDRAVLRVLYDATGGMEWSRNTNWLSDKPLNTWHGVTTGDGGRVIALRFRGNRLSGEVPTELGALSDLRELDLTGNHLIGSIPVQLGGLSSLERLLLSGNQLSGEIPHSLTELSALTQIYFDDNAGLCAPSDDAFQAWLNEIPHRGGDICPMDSAAVLAPSPMPTAIQTPAVASTPPLPAEDSEAEDSGGGCSARTGGSVIAGAGDMVLMVLPLLGLMGFTANRRWRR